MANDLNRVTLIGRLTKDPELKTLGSGTTVCKISIANNRSYTSNGDKKEEVSFFNCSAWGKRAEVLAQYVRKGAQLAISGRLQQRTWEGQDGKKMSAVEIMIEDFQFLSKSQREGDNHHEPEPPLPEVDDDIPF